jgi:hypothetical protein
VVHDQSHVGLVDAHAERVGRHDRAHVLVHERVLHLVPARVVQPRVVGDRGDLGALQHRVDALDRLARGRVDDRLPVVARQRVGERLVLLAIALHRHHVVVQVRPIEAGDDGLGALQAELRHDVAPHLGRRRRGERDRDRVAQRLAHPPHA